MHVSEIQSDAEPVESNSALIKQEHVRILRESLAWACRRSGGLVQQKLTEDLFRFAKAIQSYCQCSERVYVQTERKYACLDCGKRHDKLTLIEGGA